jgi:hypothetical protein
MEERVQHVLLVYINLLLDLHHACLVVQEPSVQPSHLLPLRHVMTVHLASMYHQPETEKHQIVATVPLASFPYCLVLAQKRRARIAALESIWAQQEMMPAQIV